MIKARYVVASVLAVAVAGAIGIVASRTQPPHYETATEELLAEQEAGLTASGHLVAARRIGAAAPPGVDYHYDSADAATCNALPAIDRAVSRLDGFPLCDDAGFCTTRAIEMRRHPAQVGRCLALMRASDALKVHAIITACRTRDASVCQRIATFVDPSPQIVDGAVAIDPSWANIDYTQDGDPPDDFDGGVP